MLPLGRNSHSINGPNCLKAQSSIVKGNTAIPSQVELISLSIMPLWTECKTICCNNNFTFLHTKYVIFFHMNKSFNTWSVGSFEIFHKNISHSYTIYIEITMSQFKVGNVQTHPPFWSITALGLPLVILSIFCQSLWKPVALRIIGPI